MASASGGLNRDVQPIIPCGKDFCQLGTGCCIPFAKDGKFAPSSHACMMKISAMPKSLKDEIDQCENDKYLSKQEPKPTLLDEKYWNEAKKKHFDDKPTISISFYSCLAMKIIHLRTKYDATQTEQMLLKHADIIECINQTHKAVYEGMLLLLPGHPIFYVDKKKETLISGGRTSVELKLRDLIEIFGDLNATEQINRHGIFLMPSVAPWQLRCFTNVMLTVDETQQSVESLSTTLEAVTKTTDKLVEGLNKVNEKITELNKNQIPNKNVVSEIKSLSQIVKGSTELNTKPKFNAQESNKLQQNQAKANKKIEAEKELLKKTAKRKSGSLTKGTIESSLERKSELKRIYLTSSHYILNNESITEMSTRWEVDGDIKIIELRKTFNASAFCVYFKSKSNTYRQNMPIGVSWRLWSGGLPLPKSDSKHEKDLYLGRIDKDVTEEQIKKWIPILFPDVDRNKIRIVLFNYNRTRGAGSWRKNLKFAYCHIVSSKKDTELVLNDEKSPPFDLNVWKNAIPKRTRVVSADKFDDYERNSTELAEYTTITQYNQNDWITV